MISGDDDHLWVVISDPSQDPDNVLVVKLLSWRAHHDQACILRLGDHPFIKHDTCVDYRSAELTSLATIAKRITNRQIKARQPVSATVLQQMRDAVENSDIAGKYYDLMRRQGFAP